MEYMRWGYIIICLLFGSPCFAQLQGRARLDSLLSALPAAKEDTNKASLLRAISFDYKGFDIDSGLFYADLSLALSEELQWTRGIYHGLLTKGINHQSGGNYEVALEYLGRAHDLELRDPEQIRSGMALLNIMLSNYYLDDHVTALDLGQKCLAMFEKWNEPASIAKVNGNLGLVYFSIGEFDQAIAYHRRALAYYTEVGDLDGQGRALGNMGNAYIEMGVYDQALEHDLAALSLYEQLGQKRGMAINLLNSGLVYFMTGELELSHAMIQRSLLLANELGNVHMSGVCIVNLGKAYAKAAEAGPFAGPPFEMKVPELLERARELLVEGMALLRSSGHKAALKDAAFSLSEVYASLGRPWESLDLHRLGAALRDSIITEDKLVRMARLEAQRQKELYDKDVEIRSLMLARTQEQRAYLIGATVFLILFFGMIVNRYRMKIRKDRELFIFKERAMEKDKALFGKRLLEIEMKALRAQMDPHFIFNCLNAIQAMILAQEQEDATVYLQKFSRLIRLVLENSRKQATTVHDEMEILSLYLDLEMLRLKEEIFTYSIVCDPAINGACEFPSMVVQPLVENSIWHGIRLSGRKGHVSVAFEKRGEELVCVVEDNGVGRARAAELDDREGHNSKGLELITERLSTWGGMRDLRCAIQTSDLFPGHGTRTEIRIGMEAKVALDLRESLDDQLEQELAAWRSAQPHYRTGAMIEAG